RIDQKADGLAPNLRNDDDVARCWISWRKAESRSQINDRKHRAAQVDHTLHIMFGVWQRRRRRPAADVADRHDVDAELLLAKTEGDELVVGTGHALFVQLGHAAFLLRLASMRAISVREPATMASTSRMTATRPSPRIVAAATPKTWP